MATIIALLSATGMRIGEALALDVADLDPVSDTILVTGKYGNKRRLPVHPSSTAALTHYLARSRELVGAPTDGALFVTGNATRPKANNIETAFRSLTQACQLEVDPGRWTS